MVHGPEKGPNAGVPVSRQDAAKLAGISDEHLRKAFRNPVIVKAYNDELDVLRSSARAMNLHTAIGIRDDKEMAKSASGNRVRIDAARFIEGRDVPANVQVNVGVNIAPGYLVGLPEPVVDGARQMLKLAGSHANVLDQSQDVHTDEAETP
jgi:hypothetical protein